MTEFPGFPSNEFDFHFEEAGGALAGLLMRDRSGNVIPGVLPNVDTLLSKGAGWTVECAPFVSARSKDRAVLLGGTTSELILEVAPAPAVNARLDVFYSLPADVAAGDPPVAAAVAMGTPSPVPAKPAIPAGAIELGTLRVSAGQSSVAQAVLTETFGFAGLTGGRLVVRNVAALSPLNVMNGTQALILSTGGSAERVKNKWVYSKTAPYSAPFKAYGPARPSIEVEVRDGFVYVSGVATTTKPNELVGTTSRLMGNIGADYAPKVDTPGVMQGSGVGRWTFTAMANGNVTAARYGGEPVSTTTWLPFDIFYPLKRV